MHIHARIIFCSFILFFCCQPLYAGDAKSLEGCNIGQKCILTGQLKIYISSLGAVGALRFGEQCVSIALPQRVIKNRKIWDEKKVQISGEVYSHSSSSGSISYKLQDREVLAGMCNADKIIYLEKIKKIK